MQDARPRTRPDLLLARLTLHHLLLLIHAHASPSRTYQRPRHHATTPRAAPNAPHPHPVTAHPAYNNPPPAYNE
ncbi:hypothetical protein GCM10010365_59100 [Streptomyces poonensis]|uniref:Uncharacterized protein n=1 Tax=Streptomyces poonensis TaxID=68255 RepID=A0A918Q1N4_9ACTN|nr:hypothetical protein GCM10010365_59100 [Streptomyces poonensis]GLJ88235.1 hypothetical protein GCM10017589_08350 [Streptomyces poonensis]